MLTHPLVGYVRRRDGRYATYSVDHGALALERAEASVARFALFERLGLVTPGAIHSVAVKSKGLYGFDANVWAGMPVRTTTPGAYEIITTYAMDDFAKTKIAATNKELVDERAMVTELLG